MMSIEFPIKEYIESYQKVYLDSLDSNIKLINSLIAYISKNKG